MSTLPEVAATATIAGVVGARIICTTTTLILLLHSWYGLHLESVKRKKSYIHTNVVGEQCWIETSFYFIFWNKKKYATNSDKYCTYYKPCLGLCDFFFPNQIMPHYVLCTLCTYMYAFRTLFLMVVLLLQVFPLIHQLIDLPSTRTSKKVARNGALSSRDTLVVGCTRKVG